MKKTLLALAMSLAAASGAHASWDTGYNETNTAYGNGEALFEAFDNIAGVSYVLDLGVRYDDLVSGAAFNGQQFTVDLSVFGASNSANVSWQIVAGSGNKRNAANTAADFSKYGILTTADSGFTNEALAYASGNIGTALGTLNAISAITGDAVGPTSVNNAVTESTPFGLKFTGQPAPGVTTGYISATYQIDTEGAITGETMNLWRLGFGTAAATKISNIIGTVNLTGNTLTLGSVAAPTVPVPAAIWLLGSALAGLGGIARRRNKA